MIGYAIVKVTGKNPFVISNSHEEVEKYKSKLLTSPDLDFQLEVFDSYDKAKSFCDLYNFQLREDMKKKAKEASDVLKKKHESSSSAE